MARKKKWKRLAGAQSVIGGRSFMPFPRNVLPSGASEMMIRIRTKVLTCGPSCGFMRSETPQLSSNDKTIQDYEPPRIPYLIINDTLACECERKESTGPASFGICDMHREQMISAAKKSSSLSLERTWRHRGPRHAPLDVLSARERFLFSGS